MKILKVIIALFLVLFITKGNSQNFELGKVSIAELEEKVHPKDTTAVAALLFKKARTFFSYNLTNGFTVNHEYIYIQNQNLQKRRVGLGQLRSSLLRWV